MRLPKIYFLIFAFVVFFIFSSINADAQCSICTRTAQQLGEKPARGLNAGILYLAFTPLILIGFIGYRFYQRNKDRTD
jgi:hypothetical protein